MFKRLILPAAVLVASACAAPVAQTNPQEMKSMVDQKLLTIERLFASPSLNGPTPSGVKYSPDGKRVSFLKPREDEGSRYDLWQFDVATGAQSMLVDSKLLEPEEVELSEEEKALRERKRIAGRKGIVSYDWGTADTILVPLGGDLHLVTLTADGAQARQLTNTDAFEYDAKVSPNGTYVSFVRDGAVYAIDLSSGGERRLTPLAEPDKAISYGVAEFVAQEEMSRYTGYWWSSDDRYLAYTRVDESTVDIIPRFDIAADEVTVINQRYPRAGRPNAIVDLFVLDMETGEVTETSWRQDDWGPATDQYLARVNWVTGGFVIQSVDRDQEKLLYQAFIVDPEVSDRGTAFTSWTEESSTWINLSNDFTANENELIISDERSGFRHLYQLDISETGEVSRHQISSGDWAVAELEFGATRSSGGFVYFTGYMDSPLERHLYRYGIGEESEPYEPVLLTERGKSWSITMAPDGKSFVGTSSSPTQPPQTGLYRLGGSPDDEELEEIGAKRLPGSDCIDLTPMAKQVTRHCPIEGQLIAWIEENKLDETHPYAPYLENHTVPEYRTMTAGDGQTLYYSIQLPPDFDPGKKYPALVEVYGGPGAQTVTRNWERLSDQFYSREGYIVFRLDNRGMANRGNKFEDVIYRQTGGPEVRDQLVGVEWLKSQPFVDADRVAIQGWSYGGYMALMTILQAPEGTFAAAVAGAPVTDWKLYDTFYTERYMDTPQDNPEGYEKSSVFYHLERLETELPNLMLVHGMADDNVTFDNTTRLMAELQQKGIVFDLMTYPGQRHGIRGETLGIHLMKTRMAFLDRHLKAPAE